MVRVCQSRWHCRLTELLSCPWNSSTIAWNTLKTHCLVRWKPEEQPSLISVINVFRFVIISSNCSFLHFFTVEESALLHFPDRFCIWQYLMFETINPAIRGCEIFNMELCGSVEAFFLSSNSIAALLALTSYNHTASRLSSS